MYSDIVAFGWNNFVHEVIDTAETLEEASKKEGEWILKFRSNEPEYGYNSHINKNNAPKAKNCIRCVETGDIFDSMAAVGRELGVTREAVRKAISNGYKCGGYTWEKITIIQ